MSSLWCPTKRFNSFVRDGSLADSVVIRSMMTTQNRKRMIRPLDDAVMDIIKLFMDDHATMWSQQKTVQTI